MDYVKYVVSGLLIVVLSGCGSSSSNPSDSAEDTDLPAPLAVSRLNDTGQALFSDGFSLVTSEPSNYPGQDAGSGRDALFAAGLLAKTGTGVAGFDFTKLDAQGADLESEALDWACVRDNHTGLVWQAANGGNDQMLQAAAQTYVDTINGEELCGFADWRMPALVELRSIAHFGTESPAIDLDFFPGTVANRYWAAEAAWFIHFHDGTASDEESIGGNYVRLVRGGVALPDERFVDHGDGTITDQLTNLMWKKCPEGREWDVDSSSCVTDLDSSAHFNWQPATVRAGWVNDGILGQDLGYTDWRLPNIKELTSLVEPEREGGRLDTSLFDISHDFLDSFTPAFWSSTHHAGDATHVRVLPYVSGQDYSTSVGSPAQILLVRSNDGGVD